MTDAKIVATLGPASNDRETVLALTDAGMSVARVNASHGTATSRAALLDLVDDVAAGRDPPLASMVDLRGPDVRTTPIDEPLELEPDATVRFVHDADSTGDVIGLTAMPVAIEAGQRILLDDGRIAVTIESRTEDGPLTGRIDRGGTVEGRPSVSAPGCSFDLEMVGAADRETIAAAVDRDVDFIAASFVRDGSDVLAVAGAVEAAGGDTPVVAKIERRGAVESLDEIVDAAHAVMVARGDLGVEYPLEEVPLIQKRVIRQCRAAGTPTIVATEMLESMIHAGRPTRAEASDVANAVLDGADAVMLSAETAVGDHPIRVLEAMGRIVIQTEASTEYAQLRTERVPAAGGTAADSLARAAAALASDVDATAIAAATESGYTARKVAKYRPGVPVVAATPDETVRRRLTLTWGVRPVLVDRADGAGSVIAETVDAALAVGAASSGDTVVVLTGMMAVPGTDTTNTLKVHVAAERLASGQPAVGGHAAGPLATADGDVDVDKFPAGAVLALPAGFDGEFTGDLARLAAIIAAEPGLTGYPAIVAREVGIPMISGTVIDRPQGTVVTVDGERGIVYEGDVRDGS